MSKPMPNSIEQGSPATPAQAADLSALYETDEYTWNHLQIEALKKHAASHKGDAAGVDWDNLIVELAAGISYAETRWRSNCRETLEHMLTILHARGEHVEPGDFEHWRHEIVAAFRQNMHEALVGNDGLKGKLLDLLGEAWRGAKSAAISRLTRWTYLKGTAAKRLALEAELKREIPDHCPWELGEVAGYNPRVRKKFVESPNEVVWPPEVAERLNRELDLSLYTGGWTAKGYPGNLRERDGQDPDPGNLAPLVPIEQSADRGALGSSAMYLPPMPNSIEQATLEAATVAAELSALYKTDAYAWGQLQVEALKKMADAHRGDGSGVDWDNLAVEFASRLKYMESAWISNCRETLERMLAIRHAREECVEEGAVANWCHEVEDDYRKKMRDALYGNDGLKGKLLDLFGEGWREAKSGAIERLTDPENFKGTEAKRRALKAELKREIPDQCPWELGEIAGYNPRIRKRFVEPPNEGVWPPEVAERLNRELHWNFHTGGWTAKCDQGSLEKRDGREPNPSNLAPLVPIEQLANRDAGVPSTGPSMTELARESLQRANTGRWR